LNLRDPFQFVWDTAKRYRTLYNGTLIINKGFTKETANKALEEGIADMVSFGELFISNPDLAERFEHNLPLQTADRSTYYVPGPKGYTDYPSII
jgi:N-ethylmaleimide reductase